MRTEFFQKVWPFEGERGGGGGGEKEEGKEEKKKKQDREGAWLSQLWLP